MKYTIYTEKDLINNIKKSYLLGDKSIKPYESADISIKDIDIETLHPTQFYFFNSHISKIYDLYKEFSKIGIDILDMSGYITFFSGEFEKELALLPPLIEKVDGKNLIIDGMHRIVLAKILGKDKIKSTYIENSDQNYLTYAVANPDGWDSVETFETEVPEGFTTRLYRYGKENSRWYSRQFDFEGVVQIPRKNTLKNDALYKKLIEENAQKMA